MKKIFITLCALIATLTMGARSLVVITANGGKAYFAISDTERPVMQFINGNVWVSGRHYQFSNIKEFRITDDDPTGISAIKTFQQVEGAIVIDTDQRAGVYTIDGKPVNAEITGNEGRQIVRVSNLPHGVYVIKAGKDSFKFVKK